MVKLKVLYEESLYKWEKYYDIEIKDFLLRYVYNGKEVTISMEDLKNFYSIRIKGMKNDNKDKW